MDVFYIFVRNAIIMNVSFTKKQEEYINAQVETGEYQNNSEVIRDALRLHSVYRDKVIKDLRMEIEKGWKGSPSKRNVLDIIKSKSLKK
ncbi:type II toxin-antitoxin system ParD family antitoxin [Polaribacter sp.]|uniref:type II toxin-antitoxin system ParD family antitoxin n=1 Tax=Polaribacter sp. TaxID=1920175 RepID=UPI003F6A9948